MKSDYEAAIRNQGFAPGGRFAQWQSHKRKQVRSVSAHWVQGHALLEGRGRVRHNSRMVGIIDYGAGNLRSVTNALQRLGAAFRFVRGPEDLLPGGGRDAFDRLIFPGDGHFANAMARLDESGLAGMIKDWVGKGRPFLGICIGLQLLFENSEEAAAGEDGEVRGLSLIRGSVLRFPGQKVPQIGWNQTEFKPGSRLFRGIEQNAFFYYIHSYYAKPLEEGVCAAVTDYYIRYCSAVERGALAAVQFHPEKSGSAGLRLLANWLE